LESLARTITVKQEDLARGQYKYRQGERAGCGHTSNLARNSSIAAWSPDRKLGADMVGVILLRETQRQDEELIERDEDWWGS
jgi:hypothetical protein